jgi:hypothetical protein
MKAIRLIVLTAIVGASLLAAGTASGTKLTTLTPVMTGLDNPRGLAFAKDGALYVAEAGRGGAGPCQTLRGVTACYGPTGRISRYWKGHQDAVVTGLPSYVTATDATGPHDLTVHGHDASITLGWGENPALRNTPPSSVWQQFGHLARAKLQGEHGKWKLGPDISGFEASANPDGGPVDTNPYGILGVKKKRVLVTDAGGNDLLSVGKKHISLVALFPSRSTTPPHSGCPAPPGFPVTDSVPDAVTVGPDHALYVGELSGAPFCSGNANVYRIAPGTPPGLVTTPYCSGFTTIIDLTWGPDGYLYVLEHSTGPVFFGMPGDVVRVGPGCAKTTVVSGLNMPGSLAFGRDGKLYISINSTSVGGGQVVRVD